ncbi:MAG: D-alanyl-D-alanine carboxypeptidase [Actinobacteria bacterium]|nr:D-alanyl-D-alanine carboxypeptidase [Actinomycetota bacterium]
MRKLITITLCLGLLVAGIQSASANILPPAFLKLATSPALANPGIIVIDPSNEGTLYDETGDTPRAPASVLKLVAMTTAITELGPTKTFLTGIYSTTKPNTFLIHSDGDPWMTASKFEAEKYHRVFFPGLISTALATTKSHNITLLNSGVYTKDLQSIQKFFSKKYHFTIKPVANLEAAMSTAKNLLKESTSPSVSEIAQFCLLYSDNLLAERLSRTAAHQMGFTANGEGIQSAFIKTLEKLEVPTDGLQVFDGSGLSHDDRITPKTLAMLLIKIKSDPDLKVIYDGLPVAGKTGTLESRFVKDAPSAVGLIKAKTGWINSSVSLAGFVEVGSEEYVFAVIADKVTPRETNRALARKAIDKMLATIAKPSAVDSSTLNK